eukprot:scaffold348489_cov28-Prasinocladus_malaysianus.AAC.3
MHVTLARRRHIRERAGVLGKVHWSDLGPWGLTLIILRGRLACCPATPPCMASALITRLPVDKNYESETL